MGFCYKTITESPRKGSASSVRRLSPLCRVHNNNNNVTSSNLSEFLASLDYEKSSTGVLDSIPEHDWRLLGALAKKRERDDERERLADEFHKMWQKEKDDRKMVEKQTSSQYKQYIYQKRQQERQYLEAKRLERDVEHKIKTGSLINYIRCKERRAADLLACQDCRKTSELIEKAVEEDARAQLAADRRLRLGAAEHFRRQLDLESVQKRVDEARRRRSDLLRNASKRVAINQALSEWEATLSRQDVLAMEAHKMAHTAAHAALTEAKSNRLLRAKDKKQKRAKKLALITRQMREAVRSGKY